MTNQGHDTATKEANPRRKPQHTGRFLRRVLAVLFVLAILAMIVVAAMPKPVSVSVVQATKGPLVVTVDEDGKTRVKDRYVVSAPLSGNVARPELKPGDSVQADAPLFRLIPLSAPLLDARSKRQAEARVLATQAAERQATAHVNRARAAHKFAEKEAVREKGLASQGASSAQALDRAMLELSAREAELASAEFGTKVAKYEAQMALAALGRHSGGEKQVDDERMIVPSPIAGRVLKVIQESEGVVQAGAPLLEVGDPKALEVVVDVLTSDAVKIRSGAKVTVDQWGGEPLEGRVRLIEPSAFTKLSALGVEEQRVLAVVDLVTPFKQWAALGDGYRVEAHIVISEQLSVLKVPASALFRHEEGWAVFVERGGEAHLAPVHLGSRSTLWVEVTKGLNPGERVVVHPSDSVAEGVKLSVR